MSRLESQAAPPALLLTNPQSSPIHSLPPLFGNACLLLLGQGLSKAAPVRWISGPGREQEVAGEGSQIGLLIMHTYMPPAPSAEEGIGRQGKGETWPPDNLKTAALFKDQMLRQSSPRRGPSVVAQTWRQPRSREGGAARPGRTAGQRLFSRTIPAVALLAGGVFGTPEGRFHRKQLFHHSGGGDVALATYRACIKAAYNGESSGVLSAPRAGPN